MANSLLYAIIFLCYFPWDGTAQTPPVCQDTGCTKHFNGEARCVYVREGNWTHIGRQFDITTAKVDGLCRSTPDDCCRCFRLATTTTTTTTSTTTTTTTTSSPGCTDVDGSCRAEFNGTGACIDVRNGDLSYINIDVKPVDGKCGASAKKCCECFMMKTRGSASPEHTSSISMSTIITTTTPTYTTTTTTTSATPAITSATTTATARITTATMVITDITTTTTTTAPVRHGGWSSWKYEKCSKPCGGGTQKGTRSCNNPTPANGGKNCVGSTTTTRSCNTNNCPLPGGWSSWRYDECSKTCGGGTQRGTRSCNNPTPAYGGKNCVGATTTTRSCNTNSCPSPVHGGWSSWKYDECSKTCGGGTQKGTRSCNTPTPANGGKNCVGSTTTTRSCNTKTCPGAGRAGDWSYCTSSKPCSLGKGDCDSDKDCSGSLVCGTDNCQDYTAEALSGADCCAGPVTVTIGSSSSSHIKTVNVNTPVSSCPSVVSKANWAGTDTYPDTFTLKLSGTKLTVTRTDQTKSWGMNLRVVCAKKVGYGGPSDGSYCTSSKPCALGRGDCDSDKDCSGSLVCGTDNCREFTTGAQSAADCCAGPVNVTIGSSSSNTKTIDVGATVSSCPAVVSKSNWAGTDTYSDKFTLKLSGTKLTVKRTDKSLGWGMNLRVVCAKKAPIDGGWSSWSYDTCSKTCGGGTQRGTRSCNNPTPANGGKNCVGATTTTRSCNTNACPSPGYCEASLNWTKCQTSNNKCSAGYRDRNYYVSSKAKCCCHCVGSNGNTGRETC